MSGGRKQTVLVTGSSGCLGQHVVRMMHEMDDTVGEVRCFDLRPYHNNLQHKIVKEMQITTGDIRNVRQLTKALEGVDVIVHCAALVDLSYTQNEKELYSVNVEGTQKVIDAAVECNVPYLIHISGADVTIGWDPIYYGSENTTIVPRKHLLGHYSKSKYEAEQLAVEANGRPLANGKDKLQTVILRPTMIYGEEDEHFLKKILSITKANGGQLRKVDNVFTRIQPVYAGNVATACLRAKDRIQVDSSIGGEAFFITDDTKILDPFEFLEPYLQSRGYKLSERAYPFWLFVLVLGWLLWVRNHIGLLGASIPEGVNPATVTMLSNTYFYNRTKATLRLDYDPQYESDESQSRALTYYKKANL